MDEKVLILAITMGYGLVEVTKAMINVILSKAGKNSINGRNKHDSKIIRMEQILSNIHEQMSLKDSDGIPLWMVPRTWGDMLKKNLDLQEKIIELQKELIQRLNGDGKKKRGRPKKK